MRASRLLSIVLHLQSRSRATAADLAREFGVSVRTVYRDVDELGAAGIPVVAARGPGGGLKLLDGYRTRLTGLTPEEAEAMCLVGLPRAAGHLGLADATARLSRKLVAAMPGPSAALAERLQSRFHVDPDDWYRGEDPPPHLPALTRAVLDARRLAFTYESWHGVKRREADPLGLVLKAGTWYLVARVGARTLTFRAGAIREPAVLDASFERPDGFDLAEWWLASIARFERELRPGRVRLRASAEGCRRLAEAGRYAARAVAAAAPVDARGWRELELPVENDEQAARLVLSMGLEVEALGPPALRRAVRRLALDQASRHGAKPRATAKKG